MIRTKHSPIAFILCYLCSFDSYAQDLSPIAGSPTGTAKHYEYLFQPGIDPGSQEKIVSALPYSKIELERTGCFGTCPVYIVTFASAGSATFTGRKYTNKTGEHNSKVNQME